MFSLNGMLQLFFFKKLIACAWFKIKTKQNVQLTMLRALLEPWWFFICFSSQWLDSWCGKRLMHLLFPSVFLSSYFIFIFYSGWQNSTDSSRSHWRALHPGHHGSDICSLCQKKKHQKETSLEAISGDRGSDFTTISH